MKLKDIKNMLKTKKADEYPHENNEWGRSVLVISEYEGGDEDEFWRFGNVVVSDSDDWWVRVSVADFNEYLKLADKETDYIFRYEEGDCDGGDEWDLQIACVTNRYVYFERD